MSVQSIVNQPSTIFSLDEILQGTPETAAEVLSNIEEIYQGYKEELNIELKTTDRIWLEFHAGQCKQYGKAAQSILYRIVKASIDHPEDSVAAANAITILKVMKVSFSCLDLRRMQIPGANLSSAILDRADLSSANLENADLRYASLNGTNMSNANLKGVKFDMPGTFNLSLKALSSMVSPDSKYLISEDLFFMYCWHCSSKTCISKIMKPNSFDYCFNEKMFTPDGQFLFIYDRDQHIDIWAVDSLKYAKKLKISESKKFSNLDLFFSPNGAHFIVYGDEKVDSKPHLQLWGIQKSENSLLDINLKNECILPSRIMSICFSKKFPVFYCFRGDASNRFGLRMTLSICKVEEASKIVSVLDIGEVSKVFIDLPIWTHGDVDGSKRFSIAVLDTDKNNEELLFVAIHNFIYCVNILKKEEQHWALESAQVTKIVTEIDAIYDIKILVKTHELIYISNYSICLYDIRNKQLIGRFRLLDRALHRVAISPDEANIYINFLNKTFVYAIDALRNNKYISYEIANKTVCFSPDMRSIISLSDNYSIRQYDIETGNVLKLKIIQNILPIVSGQFINTILFSLDTQNILINLVNSTQDPASVMCDYNFLYIINVENNEKYLKIPSSSLAFILSSTSEYLALEYPRYILSIYNIPSKKCIGQFPVHNFSSSRMAISTDFCNSPKVALTSKTYEIIVCDFVFKNEALELMSQKKLPIEVYHGNVLQLVFTDNDSKLIIASKKKIIVWNIYDNFHREYDIQANFAAISQDRSLLIYYSWDGHDLKAANHQLCLWSITEEKLLIAQSLSLTITKLQISADNRYIIGKLQNGGMYIWKIIEDTFRLLWRTTHNLQAQGLIIGNNNLEKGVEEELLEKMGALKL